MRGDSTCCVLAPGGEVELDQLDRAGADWFGEGPGGVAMGTLEEVLADCAGEGADPEWIDAVTAALTRHIEEGWVPRLLLVKRRHGWMFHTARAICRDSIARHGLDWRRMFTLGIAGSERAEAAGVFLSATLESAQWFAVMSGRGLGAADIWRVRVDGLWLEGDPNGGGGDDDWMICPAPIPPERIELFEADVHPGGVG